MLLKVIVVCTFLQFLNTLVASEQETQCEESAEGIEFKEVRDGLNEGTIVFVDVRSKKELKDDGVIPKSHNIIMAEIESAFKLTGAQFFRKYGFKKPNPALGNLVISCQAGIRALTAWEMLRKYGYCSARVYYGSFEDWEKNKGEIIPYDEYYDL